MPRLVRRQTFTERALALLNPLDWLLYFYTLFESYDWDSVQSTTAIPLGLALNLLLFISRLNCSSQRFNDVLIPPRGSSSYGSSYVPAGYFLWLFSSFLAGICVLNTIICFTRKKKYRMFECDIDVEPSTPSAKRVRVDSSPSDGLLSRILRTPTADSRAHPNQTTDVWEISVWHPSRLSLRLFAVFSPAHVALYFLVFPINQTNWVTSTTSTYLTVLLLQVLLSIQMLTLQDFFTQQAKDRAIINKEVFREYDTKFVHPRVNTIKRDVATQCADDHFEASVDIYTPEFNRMGFKVMANPAYSAYTSGASHYSGIGSPTFQHHRPGSSAPVSEYDTPINYDRRKNGPLFATSTKSNSLSSSRDIFGSRIKKEPESSDDGVGSSLALPVRNPSPVRRTTTSSRSSGPNGNFRPNSIHSTRGEVDEEVEQYKTRITGSRASSSSYGRDTGAFPRHSGAGTGVIGMVNMSLENSRTLTPSKMSSPIKKGSRARGSTYAASLGGGLFGTPKR